MTPCNAFADEIESIEEVITDVEGASLSSVSDGTGSDPSVADSENSVADNNISSLADSDLSDDSDLPDAEEVEEPPFLSDGLPEFVEIADDDSISLFDSEPDSDSGADYKNVVVYTGRFNNTDCQIVFPIDALESLDIINGYLVNVSSSSVTGRLLYDGAIINPSDYDCYDYVLSPLYGSTNNVYQYGSRNYQRHYFLNTNQGYNRITYSDMYGNFYPSDYERYHSEKYRMYYLALISLIAGGAFLICRKH